MVRSSSRADGQVMDTERMDLSEHSCSLVNKKVLVTNAPNVFAQGVKDGQVCSNIDRSNPVHQQQHKKKVTMRRLNTKRPYQERLLNMAEARKQVVTALKFHRASMKQQRKQEAEQAPQQMYASYDNRPVDLFSHLKCHDLSYGFHLPSKLPLGLSLSFQDFSNFQSPSSPASSATTEESHSAAEVGLMSRYAEKDGDVVVWNDSIDLATSPEEFEISKDEELFGELMEIPSWLNSKDLTITCSEYSSPDPALPCLDIGEMEGMDEDWLACDSSC